MPVLLPPPPTVTHEGREVTMVPMIPQLWQVLMRRIAVADFSVSLSEMGLAGMLFYTLTGLRGLPEAIRLAKLNDEQLEAELLDAAKLPKPLLTSAAEYLMAAGEATNQFTTWPST